MLTEARVLANMVVVVSSVVVVKIATTNSIALVFGYFQFLDKF